MILRNRYYISLLLWTIQTNLKYKLLKIQKNKYRLI